MRQGDDGAIRGRVAEPAGLTNGAWARVLGIGDRQLRRAEHGFAGRGGGLGGGQGEPRVLALVVGHDSLEAVVGIEATRAHQPRLVRLDPEPEIDDRVDRGMPGDEPVSYTHLTLPTIYS